ncbi:MAG: hypothetical protein K2K12_00350, partial [Clostridia bacterium]|nr:hypothetical protein [Clostridia bacterium]
EYLFHGEGGDSRREGSTLSTLSSRISALTVEEVFGEDMYCYLSLEESGEMTYNQLIEAYENTYRFDEAQSDIRPNPIELAEGEEIKYDETEECYYLYQNGARADKLDQYLDGTWYLLFGNNEKMGKTPILEMGTDVLEVINKVNEMPLWWLWLHNIIKANPYKELAGGKNLNEYNLKDFIDYVKELPQIP